MSAVLNRVTGGDPSSILGRLSSNGRVFLINPNGIVFGAGAQINVAGLVASTLNLSNDDFLNNRLRFTDGALGGSVVNQGGITGGSVYLVGKAVTNDGLITSPNGEVVLAAGNSVVDGTPTSGSITTGDIGDDSVFTCLTRVRPRFVTYPSSASLTNYYRNVLGQSLTAGAGSTLNNGKFDFEREARWHRLLMQFNGATEISGFIVSGEIGVG